MTTLPPKPRIRWLTWAVLFLIAVAVLLSELYLVRKSASRSSDKALPVLATVPEFSLTSETGAKVTRESMLGKIWIADFIFTRCAGPCPLMTEQMRQLQNALSKAPVDTRLISVTVDPEYDQPAILGKYAAKYGANPDKWSFLTGEPEPVEKFITKGMLLGLSKDGEGMPVHSQKFVVVDRQGNVRAYHDLEDGKSLLPKILQDIEALAQEKSLPPAGSTKP